MAIVLYIALGGALGAVARYGLGSWIHSWAGTAFPWGTFVINALGSLMIGLSLQIIENSTITPQLRALLIVGILGAFTTFSTFAHETITLLQEGAWAGAAIYSVGSLLIGVAAAGAGLYLGAQVVPAT